MPIFDGFHTLSAVFLHHGWPIYLNEKKKRLEYKKNKTMKENKETKTIKAYKGFDSQLKCRDFQYEVGKEYKMEGKDISICKKGFHAIDEDECPLSVFSYYPPCGENGTPNRYCQVEVVQ